MEINSLQALFGTREMRPDADDASVFALAAIALAANGEVKKKKKKKVKDKAAVASEGKAGGSNWAALSTVSTLGNHDGNFSQSSIAPAEHGRDRPPCHPDGIHATPS